MWYSQSPSLIVWKAARLRNVKLYQESKNAGCSFDHTTGPFEDQDKGQKLNVYTSVNVINIEI